MQPLIQPNWHMAIVHFPIGLIVVGTLVELFSFLGWRGSGFRRAGRWMLLIGAVSAVPVTFSGLYAWAELLPPGGINELRQTRPFLAKVMTFHIWSQAAATLAAMFVVVVWISLSAFWRDRLNLLFKLALIGVAGLILYGSHLGGEAVYNQALGVDADRPPTSMPSTEQARHLKTYEELAPPVQTHVTMAGLAAAIACVTLGLAIRVAGGGLDEVPPETDHAGRIAAAFSSETIDSAYPPAAPIIVSRNYIPALRPTRFWLLSALLLIVTALLGDWVIAQESGWDLNAIWDAIRRSIPGDPADPALTRRLAHLIAGSVLIVDTLILAILARFAPRQSVALLVFAVPLVIALAVQVWLGVLLLFDGPMGVVTRFNG